MNGWDELKEAFRAALEGGPAERARQSARLASIDPELPKRLDALLAADAAGDALEGIFQSEAGSHERPTRIGAYDVIGVLGVGGMGEVYRASDARLHRDVAIKVLPPALASDAERLARFEHEARVLASLNHPHVAQIYGLEEVNGLPALVMEVVEGPTLAQFIANYSDTRPSFTRVLTIAHQIADGLAAVHEKGIIHRDLKPGNIALTEDGAVKILDFGVAKSLGGLASNSDGSAPGTGDGVLLGTPAYMSPEQARGGAIDRRTDIWAFGCVLYEMLTGNSPFAATTPSDSLAAVLTRDPDLELLPAETPAAVRSLMRHCLDKEPNRRLRDIADARLAIEDALGAPSDDSVRSEHRKRGPGRLDGVLRTGRWQALAILGAVAIVSIAIGWLMHRQGSTAQALRTVSSLSLPRGMHLHTTGLRAGPESRFAIAPDGRRLVVVAADSTGLPRLWIRDLGSAVLQPLPETENAGFPFWSPDSESLGFVVGGKLMTMRVYGGAPVTLSKDGIGTGSWSSAGVIVFAPGARSPLYSVPASGGTATQVTVLDTAAGEVQHSEPFFLPDGRHFLYFSHGSRSGGALDPNGVFLGSLDRSSPAKLLLAGVTQARYASGRMLFVQGGTLMAQSFDPERLMLRGSPSPVVEDIRLSEGGATGATAGYSVSNNGVLAYQAALRPVSHPVWFDRTGAQFAAVAPAGDFADIALSPNGKRVAVSVEDHDRGTRDLWLYDSDGGPAQRLTSDAGDEFAPVWSANGARLLFSGMRGGRVFLFLTDPAGVGNPSPLGIDTLGDGKFASDWSHDDRYFLYVAGGRAIARSDLWIAPVNRPSEARPLLNSTFVETHGRIHPAGDWFAYSSNETGRMEVYAARLPDGGGKRIVSVGGGGWPRWSRNGAELYFFSSSNELMAATVRRSDGQLDISAPRRLFVARPRPPVRLDAYAWDVSSDGRFLINTLVEEPASSMITLVLNWTASLPR